MSVVIDAVNNFFAHPPSHQQYPYDEAPPPPRQAHMSNTARRASSSSTTSTVPQSQHHQQQYARPPTASRTPSHTSSQQQQQQQRNETRLPSPPLPPKHDPSSSDVPQPAAQAPNTTPMATSVEPRQSRPQKIRVRDLEHIQSFATEDMGAFSEIRSASRSRSRSGGDESPQYEISEMKVEHIIEMVAGLLTKITTTNDQQHEHLHRQPSHLESAAASHLNPQTTSVLAFHGKNVPSITILSYLSRINKYCPTSYEVFLSLLVYFDRMTEKVNAGPMQSMRQANEAALERNRSASSSSSSLGSDEMEGIETTSATPEGAQTVTPPASGSLEKAVQEGRPGTPHSRSFQAESPGDAPPPDPSVMNPYNLSHFFVVDSFNIHRLVIAGVTCASKFFSDIFYTNSRYAKVGGLPLPELNHLELQFLLLNDFRLSVPVEEIEAYGTMLVEFYAREIVAQQKVSAAAAQAQAMQARSLSESSSDSTSTVRAVA